MNVENNFINEDEKEWLLKKVNKLKQERNYNCETSKINHYLGRLRDKNNVEDVFKDSKIDGVRIYETQVESKRIKMYAHRA